MDRGDPKHSGGSGADPGQRRKRIEGVGAVLGDALRAMEIDRAQPAAEAAESWLEAVGAEVARHSRPVGVKAGVLHVEVDSSVWCQQLQLQTPEILTALRGQMEEGRAPTELRFRVGYTRPS